MVETYSLEEYHRFLASKKVMARSEGISVPSNRINPRFFPFQKDIVNFDLERGKSANFAHTGLGKGPIQMEWCSHISEGVKGNTLIAAPLCVAQQFKREAVKFNYDLTLCQDQSDVRSGMNVTNYERLELFDLSSFVGVSLDESSILKDWTSKTAQSLIERLSRTQFKLCSTATPSPNDHAELGTHSELLDVMSRPNMLAMFFEHDGGETSKWVLKPHGKKPFFRSCASWAVCCKTPSDLGYADDGFALPPLTLEEHIVPIDYSVPTEGMLYRDPDLGAIGIHKEMRLTAEDRARKTADLVTSNPNVPWIIWVNTDYDADAVKKFLPGAVDVRGRHTQSQKESAILGFLDGKFNWLLSKPSIFGWGLNLQHCRDMAFCGMNYSWESFFQCIRRCWRFGQTEPVYAHVIIAETEGAVLNSIREKESRYEELQAQMVDAMRDEQLAARHKSTDYNHTIPMEIPAWLISQLT